MRLIWLCITWLLTSCSGSADGPSASARTGIKVNDREISAHQLELAVQRQTASLTPSQMKAAQHQVVQSLIDQELAAQAARQLNLDRDPRVAQMMEAAQRDVLARAYVEHMTQAAPEPSLTEVDRYYEDHPALFSQRKLYVLQETSVALPLPQRDRFIQQVHATQTLAQLNDLLRKAGWTYSVRNVGMPAEEIPMDAVKRLAQARSGQSAATPDEDGARVLTLISAQSAPIDRTAGRRAIAAYLLNERKQQLARQGIQAIRKAAKIEYHGRHAPLQAAAASASAASPPP